MADMTVEARRVALVKRLREGEEFMGRGTAYCAEWGDQPGCRLISEALDAVTATLRVVSEPTLVTGDVLDRAAVVAEFAEGGGFLPVRRVDSYCQRGDGVVAWRAMARHFTQDGGAVWLSVRESSVPVSDTVAGRA